jgi:hypothetical protein
MRLSRVGSEADPETTGIVTPVWREDALESWNEVDVSAVRDGGGERLETLRVIDEANGFTPVDSSASYLDGAFEGVLGLSVNIIAQSRQKSMIRLHDLRSRILKKEAPSAVRILHLSFPEHVPETGRMLIAKNATDWDALKLRDCREIELPKVITGLLPQLGQPFFFDFILGEHFFAPLEFVDVHQHRPTRIRRIHDHMLAIRQISYKVSIDRRKA